MISDHYFMIMTSVCIYKQCKLSQENVQCDGVKRVAHSYESAASLDFTELDSDY